MPPKRSIKKNSNGHKSKSTPSKSKSKSPQAITQLKRQTSKLDYIVNARDVMSLKFVRSSSDLESLDGFFSPVYVHQLFQNEKIIGYKELQIRVFFSQPSLHCYIEIQYNEKLNFDDTTDIIKVFEKWIQAGFTQNKKEFIKKLNEEFIPFGELQCQFIRPDHEYNTYNNHNINNITPKRNNKRNNRNKPNKNQSDNEDLSPRDVRLLRRKRRLNEMNNDDSSSDSDMNTNNNNSNNNNNSDIDTQPRKRRKLMDNNSKNRNIDIESDSDAEDQKKDCIQSNDYDIFNNKNNQILNSKFDTNENEFIYEIRIGSFSGKRMREFHLRLQFFVLLYIESSSFLDIKDEIWEVMVIYRKKNGKIFETLGYVTLYKFYAYPDKKRLRISQVIIFPPYQRKGLGFETLQHVYLMAKYRDFIEVNVEEPGPEFQKLRDTTDVYNAYKVGCFNNKDFKISNLTTFHNAQIYNESSDKESEFLVSYSPNTKKNKKYLSQNKKPLFPFVSQHKKLSKDIYHSVIMNSHKILKITPEQSRIAYECLKYEYTYKLLGLNDSSLNLQNGNDNDTLEWKLFKLDVKRRLYAVLNLESIHNYDENALFGRLAQEFGATIERYDKIIKKRNDWLKTLNDWDKTHEYPQWIKKKFNSLKQKRNCNLNKKKTKNKKRRR